MVSLSALRTAVRLRLATDATLIALLGGPYVYHRFVRDQVHIPSVTYFDATSWPTALYPRMEASFTLDSWARDVDTATAIAARCATLLDQRESDEAGLAPMRVPDGEVEIAAMALESQSDMGDPDVTIRRVTQRYAVVAFALAGT